MAKSRPDKRNRKRKRDKPKPESELPPLERAQHLLDQASYFLQTGQPDEALPTVKKCLQVLNAPSVEETSRLPALERLAEIYIELGEPDKAQATFLEAVTIDPLGEIPEDLGGGPDKFLWLAQLSEEGGAESVKWFEKGIAILRTQVGEKDPMSEGEDGQSILEEKRSKLANALCGVAEVYMTDLSWEEDAESRCEALVTEACLVAPNDPEPLQTLASVRISQTKFEDARGALERSLGLWQALPPEDPNVPAFATRISLSRLLMETELEGKALDVLERLITEDDSSVEAWYLGGWCLYLLGQKTSISESEESGNKDQKVLKDSRDWLENSLRLYSSLEYEDDRLKEHAEELVRQLDAALGPKEAVNGEDDDEEDWASEDEDDADSGMDDT